MKKTILIFAVTIFAAMACKKEDTTKPVASFNITSNDTLNVEEDFEFTNTSTNATSYIWDFGDGTTATTTNAVKSYDSDDSSLDEAYNTVVVKLTAKDANGNSSVATKNIVVTQFR